MNVKIENLELYFKHRFIDKQTVLKIDELLLHSSQNTVIRGASGAGKSSLLYVLAGMWKPNVGKIYWNNLDLYTMKKSKIDEWRRQNVGFIFQDFHLFSELSTLNNVMVSSFFHGKPTAEDKDRALHLLQKLGIKKIRKTINGYSRGEKQRIAIARAFFQKPKVILADEPTASLDEDASKMVVDWLIDLSKDEHSHVIAASHDPVLISAMDNVITLEHGIVKEVSEK